MMLVVETDPAAITYDASPTGRKIESFRNLSHGWNFGEGVAFGQQVIEAALRLLAHLESYGYTETDAFPGLEGEILVKGYGRTDRVELIAESDGSFTFAVPGGSEFRVYDEDLSENECVKRISKMVLKPGLISESSIPSTILTEETGDSLVLLLAAKAGSFLSSVNVVPLRRADLFAST
jgi:hypothetical protein